MCLAHGMVCSALKPSPLLDSGKLIGSDDCNLALAPTADQYDLAIICSSVEVEIELSLKCGAGRFDWHESLSEIAHL
jgi:hypothetical protein